MVGVNLRNLRVHFGTFCVVRTLGLMEIRLGKLHPLEIYLLLAESTHDDGLSIFVDNK